MSKNFVKATVRVVDHDVADAPRPDDLAKLSAPLTSMLTAELDEARRFLRVRVDELLLAALGRTIARTIGAGEAPVDVVEHGGFALSLTCVTARQASATKMLRAVHRAVAAARQNGHGPTPRADVLFSFVDGPAERAYRQSLPSPGHAIEVRMYRTGCMLQMDWWYDTRRLERCTVEELTEQFPLALIELTSEAAPMIHEPMEIALPADTLALADS